MDEERPLEELDEELEDLDEMDEFSLDMQDMSDLEGLEEMPESEEAGFAAGDIIITYDDKIVDETKELETKFNALMEKIKSGESVDTLNEAAQLLNEGKRLEAHYLTSKIASLIASVLTSEQKHKDATEYYLMSVSEARKSEDKKLHLLSLSRFGSNLAHFDLKDAAVVFNQAREIAQELGAEDYFAENSLELAHCFFETDRENASALYDESKLYFEKTGDKKSLGIISYRLGLISLETEEYSAAFELFYNARGFLEGFSDSEVYRDNERALHVSRLYLKKGHAVKYHLRLPKPEPLVDSPGTKKVFQIYTATGLPDIVSRIEKEQIKFLEKEEREVEPLRFLFEENLSEKLTDDELLENSKLYEDIGDLYQKEEIYGSAFYNYLGAQISAYQAKNEKRAEKIKKKQDKLISIITENEEDTTLLYDAQLYMLYQLAFGTIGKNPKIAKKSASEGLSVASKRNNPYFEGLHKEILADVKAGKDPQKSVTDYQAVISIYESLENYVCLMRVYEKVGNILLSSQTDKAKEYLQKAVSIANNLEKSDIVEKISSVL